MPAPPRPVVRTRLPLPLLEVLDRDARLRGLTRSELLRGFVERGLRARGLWPPAPEDARNAA